MGIGRAKARQNLHAVWIVSGFQRIKAVGLGGGSEGHVYTYVACDDFGRFGPGTCVSRMHSSHYNCVANG